MFVVKVSGGLGNQMYQYVFGQYLSKKFNIEVKYEISFYENQPENLDIRSYELNKFNLDAPIIKNDFFDQIKDLSRPKKIIFFLSKFFFNFKQSFFIILEANYMYLRWLPRFIKNRYFIGYWQNEFFFQGIEDSIADWFVLKDEFEAKKENLDTLLKINNSNSISIGVRRGDYVKLSVASDISYYNQAISIICSKVTNPVFFIFSDDIDWCKENLTINYSHFFVRSSQFLPFEDMELISKCQHNIISNSSYGWWGAYLNNNQDKIVISPKNSRSMGTPNFIQI